MNCFPCGLCDGRSGALLAVDIDTAGIEPGFCCTISAGG